ncbi:MAG: TetR family transcriptional regulator [Alphaproteobacteria bacterium]|nr:TetR family transcriptional regulator [Alphaproteobacteria bacterium]
MRSQGTRDRILAEARRLFAERGFERTTMRAIATAANINVSIVARYYGSKADLFALAAQLDIQLPDLSAVPPDKRGEAIVAHFIDIRERSDDSDPLMALVRSAVSHEVARQRYFDFIRKQVDQAVLSTIPKEQREEVFGLILIQLIGIGFSRYILKHPSVASLKKDILVREIGAALQKFLSNAS